MNAIMKINGVTGEGLAQLLQVIESDQTKVEQKVQVQTIEHEPKVVSHKNFRYAKILEVKPEEQGANTYLITLKVHMCVWLGAEGGELGRFGRDDFLSLFRAIDPNNLPSQDNGRELREMMTLLLSLEGKTFPHEVCEDEKGGGKVIIKSDTPLTTELILEKIFPRLEFVELHGYRQNRFVGDSQPIAALFKAREIARSLNL